MSQKSVLFVVRSFSGAGATPIRFRNIISHLTGDYSIHVLELTRGKPGVREENGITVHSMAYSLIGRLINSSMSGKAAASGRSGSHVRIAAAMKRKIRSLFFPDSVITEGSRLRRKTVRLTNRYGYNIVVLSAFPFTVLCCAKALKRDAGAMVILDVGDPFYRNSRNGYIRDLLARHFEERHLRYINHLIVTNEMTRAHYLRTFSHPGPEAVHIVPMGISEALVLNFSNKVRPDANDVTDNRFILVYAGQLYRKFREPYELFRAVRILNNEPGVKVELQMYGSFSREFSAGYEAEPGISFKGQLPHQEIGDAYYAAGAVVFIDNSIGLQTPGKVFEVALTARPVLFISDRDDSPALEVVRGMKHIVVTPNSADLIVKAIREVMVLQPVYIAHDEAKMFLWKERADQYRQILSLMAGE